MNYNKVPWSRRELLHRSGCGFGHLALMAMLSSKAARSTLAAPENVMSARSPMFPARAKRVIFLFMNGAPSQVDTFDYKPELKARHGQTSTFENTRTREIEDRVLLGSPWKFDRYGESGQWVSTLFPELSRHVDELCFLKAMHTEGVAHGPATLFMHTGATSLVRPSIGSWVTYGLGSESENLPGFVTICPSANIGGARNYSNSFLPSVYQGTAIGRAERSSSEARFHNLDDSAFDPALRESQHQLLQRMNATQVSGDLERDALEATIRSFEMAYRMQRSAPMVTDIDQEPEAIKKLYGIGEKETDDFGRQCLLARRLCEEGVRFVQANFTDNTTTPKWDQHRNLKEDHELNARSVDRPIAGLLTDLKQRGMLEDTLVWWGGEFGRTPYSENDDGRDHNPHAFTVWLAGGGVKGGLTHGESDPLGFRGVSQKVHTHDLHATILHLLGLDHEKLTYRYAGRDFRLTDVFGEIVKEILI